MKIDFYFITDSGLSKKGNLSDVENAVKAGCKIVQYRAKNKEAMIEEAKKIKKLCENKALFIVNDLVDVALAVDADGVHLGQHDMPIEMARGALGNKKLIGITTHNAEEAIDAEKKGADYISVGPIFNTTTKKDALSARGVEIITKIKEKVNLPIVAIGGINKENLNKVVEAGADSVAAISSVVCADDVYKEVLDFIQIIKEKRNI